VVRECQRIAAESTARGLEHFAAIGYHNIGEMQLRMGQIDRAIANLEKASRFWAETPTNPFAHHEELVMALLVAGQRGRAVAVAAESIRRTTPWPRPAAQALYGWASVLAAEGRLSEAIEVLRDATSSPEVLGAASAPIYARLVECLYLDDQAVGEIMDAKLRMQSGPPIDPRYSAEIAPARSIAIHVEGACTGKCLDGLSELADAESVGAKLVAAIGRVKIGALALEHRAARAKREAWIALGEALPAGFLEPIRWWVRRYAPHAQLALSLPAGGDVLAELLAWDPEGWRNDLLRVLPLATGRDRAKLLGALTQHANRETVAAMERIPGPDVAEARRHLQKAYASRIYLRTFGGISVRRGGWQGPTITIEKRRVRALLAVLGAHAHTSLTRDMAIDILWPEADGDSAVNNLNQTVFQLRRYLDRSYRQGESPEYIVSSAEQISLAPDLVHTDLQEIRRHCDRLNKGSWHQRQEAATKAIAFVRGEFLADLRYETWASRLQVTVHNEVRSRLLPIATQSHGAFDVQVATDAAAALVAIDPFDEAATLALAECLSRSGRRMAARDLLVKYADQLRAEFDDDPPPLVSESAERIRDLVKSD
jgi:DNA-binding SARP family transcriptional activator